MSGASQRKTRQKKFKPPHKLWQRQPQKINSSSIVRQIAQRKSEEKKNRIFLNKPFFTQ
jgi:hypothetical protein